MFIIKILFSWIRKYRLGLTDVSYNNSLYFINMIPLIPEAER